MRYEPRLLNLEDWDCKVVVGPADPDLSPVYRAAYYAILAPHWLAITLGKLPESRLTELLAKLYAASVMLGGPGFEAHTPSEWEEWLLADLERFAAVRSICEVKRNFLPNGAGVPDGERDQHTGETPR